MNFNLPPIIPYAVGAMLVLFGLLRVKYLSAPRFPREPSEAEQGEAAATATATATADAPVRGKEQKRHLRMGILWVAMGVFLVVSTYLQLRKQG